MPRFVHAPDDIHDLIGHVRQHGNIPLHEGNHRAHRRFGLRATSLGVGLFPHPREHIRRLAHGALHDAPVQPLYHVERLPVPPYRLYEFRDHANR